MKISNNQYPNNQYERLDPRRRQQRPPRQASVKLLMVFPHLPPLGDRFLCIFSYILPVSMALSCHIHVIKDPANSDFPGFSNSLRLPWERRDQGRVKKSYQKKSKLNRA